MDATHKLRIRQKCKRGNNCTAEEFAVKYGLELPEAKRLYDRFGPSEIELAVLMAGKGIPARQ